jgi:outer membrane lipoprotein-sorting protein
MRQWLRACGVVIAVAVLVVGIAAAVSAQTVDELVAKNLAARGGLDKLKAITTMKMTGKLVTQGQEMQIVFWMKRPNLVLQEMTFQGGKMVRAFDGQKAWMLNPFMGSSAPQEIPGPESDLMKNNSDFDGPLIDYKAKGSKIELAGSDTVDGTKAYRLKVTLKSGGSTDIYLDATSGLEIKLVNELNQGGQKITIETLPSNYKPVSGILMPHTIKSLVNGQVQAEVAIDSIEIGIPIEDSVFKMPRKGAPPPGGRQR